MDTPASNPMALTGHTILVTGASSGIGRDTAVLLSELGATVVLVARSISRLEETLSRMQPGSHVLAPFDVTSHSETETWMRSIAAEHGKLYGLVHAAGATLTEGLRYMDPDHLDHMIDLNLKSAFSILKAFRLKQVRDTGGSSVVLVSSVAGLEGYSGLSAYSATKGGIMALTRTLAIELAREKIRINCIAPGFIDTALTQEAREYLDADQWQATVDAHPLGLGKPRDASNAIAFLLSSASRWITGTTLVVDGGRTIQ